MATAVVSALTKNPVRNDIAMTGEITLRGEISFRVWRFERKVACGIQSRNNRYYYSERKQSDIDDVPKEVRSKINFIPVKSMDTVLENALR